MPMRFVTFAVFALLPFTAFAGIPPVTLKPVVTNQFNAPTTITNAGDGSGRLFICEQRGRVRIFQNGMLLPAPFLDIRGKLVAERAGFDERGLIGLAFHPGYGNSLSPGYRRFYVFYSAPSPNAPGTAADPVDCRTTVSEYRVSLADPNVADPLSERILLTFDKPQFNHNGGQLEFGPDGLLYLATGDGGSSNDNNAGHTGGSAARPTNNLGNSQDKTRLLGKILRIDPLGNNGSGGQYGIPAGNPFVGAGGGVREEIFAYGLRNPWRFSFDTGPGGTGRFFVADVGQGQVEEVNIVTSGNNYGWRNREGTFVPSFSIDAPAPGVPLIDPIAQYAHPGVTIGSPALPQLGISITGGYVYRGSAIPALQGKYIFADYSSSTSLARGVMLGLEETAPNVWALSTLALTNGSPLQTRIYAMGRDEQGELYIGTNTTLAPSQLDPGTGLPAGAIYKIVAPVPVPVTLEPSKDNTVYSLNPSNSNGQGFLFAGRTAIDTFSHALIAFNPVGAVPAGAPIVSAELAVTVSKAVTGPFDFSLFKNTQDWGEGASNAGDPGGGGTPAAPGDATWTFNFFNTSNWTTPGGTAVATASATTQVAGNGTYLWSGPGLIADVNAWIATPAQNFGWMLRGDETANSVKRFFSGEDSTVSNRPKLTIAYGVAPALTRREEWLQQYFYIGQFVDDFADLEGDGISNQIEYASGYSPKAANPPALIASTNANGSLFNVTFRRDPRATDLTYRLQTSPDLVTWTTVVQSVGGAPPSGAALLSDNVIAPEAPMRLVTAQEVLVPGSRRFARLVVVREL